MHAKVSEYASNKKVAVLSQLKGLEIGFWLLAWDGFIVYAMGATEISDGPGMLTSRFGFTS
jgi:hypothetical protein